MIPYSIYKAMVTQGLVPVEYIENTGNSAYIDTGVKPTECDGVSIEYQATSTPNRVVAIFGAMRTASADNYCLFLKMQNATRQQMRYGTRQYNFADADTSKHVFIIDGNQMTYDTTTTYTFDVEKGLCRYNIYLFACNYYDSHIENRGFVGRIFSFKIKDERGNLIRNYFPCVNSSNVVGMYDAVSGEFVTSANSDTFAAGSPISVEYYDALQILSNGTSFHGLELRKYTVDSVVMSLGDKITGDAYYQDNSLAFTMQEYVVYKGVRYVLVNPPTVVREGLVKDNSQLKGMTKYSFEFYHPMYMLGNFPFTDIAVTDRQRMYLSQNKTFSWIGNLFEFIDKLNANLKNTEWIVESNITHYEPDGVTETSEWKKAMTICGEGLKKSSTETTSDNNVLSFDKQYVSDALKTAYDTWTIPFVITQKMQTVDGVQKKFVIEFGLPTQEIYALDQQGQRTQTPFVFRFGQGVGLKNNSRNPRNNKIVTRICGSGAERNVPFGYPQIPWTGDQTWDYTINNAAGMQTVVIDGVSAQAMSYPIYDGVIGGHPVKLIKHPFTRKTLMPSIYADTVNRKVNPLATGFNPNTEIVDYYDAVDDASHTYPNNINPLSPSVDFHQFDAVYPRLADEKIDDAYPYDENAVKSITFAQFGQMIAALEVGAINANEADQLRQCYSAVDADFEKMTAKNSGGSYTFSWSVARNGDYVNVIYTSDNASFSVIVVRKNITPAVTTWDDSVKDDGTYKQPYFKMQLPQLDFDLYACAIVNSEMNINMRSGDCLGCNFEIEVDWDDYKNNFYQQDGTFDPVIHTTAGDGHVRDGSKYPDTNAGSVTLIVKKDADTFGTLKPNIYQQPQSGDKFVILGIGLPQSYVNNAQTELDDTMKEYMLENNIYYFDYPMKFDEFFLTNNDGILSQIKNNNIVRFQYAGSEMALYIKQITKKYGENVLPQYDITLADDIEIVLNKIGQVTDDVSRMQVQLSELQKYYSENIINELNSKLSKIVDDVCEGRITFQAGLNAIGSVIFSSELKSPDFETGLYTGRGWRIDQLGNSEFESLRVRSYLEVVELLVNRMQAQEGDTVFSDNDQIDKVDPIFSPVQYTGSGNPSEEGMYELVNGEYVPTTDTSVVSGKVYYEISSYVLSLKEKYDGYVTAQRLGNVIKGIINTLAAQQAGVSDITQQTAGDYYTSWMQCVQTHTETDSSRSDNVQSLGVNQIRVKMYIDSDTPASQNFAPCELMTIARWGSVLDPNASGISSAEKERRRRLRSMFYISTTEGRIVKLVNVSKPKLDNANYGTTLGELPQFVKNYPAVAARMPSGRDYLYAQGVVVEDFIKIARDGTPQINYVDRGTWAGGATYLFEEFNENTGQYETHDVYYQGSYWRTNQHIPIDAGGGALTYPAPEDGSQYWTKLISKGDTIYQPTVYKCNPTRPATPSGANIPPTGWANKPLSTSISGSNTPFADADDSSHEEWRVAKGNDVDDAWIKDVVTFNGVAGEVFAIEIEASSENSYDGIIVGLVDDTYSSRNDIIDDENQWDIDNYIYNHGDRCASGTERKKVSITVPSTGEHTVEIIYTKDGGSYSNKDCAWYRIVKTVWSSTSVITNGTLTTAWSTPLQYSAQNGTNGKIGRFFYYAGEWSNTGTSFKVSDAQAPFFKYGSNYWVFNPEVNGTYPMSSMGTPSSLSDNWQIMTNDFKYIITEAIFASFAHFGSAIISGDWMISQHGKIYDSSGTAHVIDATHSWSTYTVNNAYTLFDANYPNSSKPSANNFVPNYAVDLLTGKTYQQDAYVRGEIHATSGEFEGIVKTNYLLTGTYEIDFDNISSPYTIDLDQDPHHLYVLRGSGTVYLPPAAYHEGAELQFIQIIGQGETTGIIDVGHASLRDIYCQTASNYYDYCSEFRMNRDELVTIKAIGGYWWVLNADIRGSY